MPSKLETLIKAAEAVVEEWEAERIVPLKDNEHWVEGETALYALANALGDYQVETALAKEGQEASHDDA